MTRLSAAVLVLVGALGLAGQAAGDPLPEAARRRAEDAFVRGRLEDLDAILGTGREAVDLEPLAVRDLLWRPDRAPRLPERDDGSLSSRRIAWLVRARDARRTGAPPPAEAYPQAGEGARDPYPRLTALVLDRLRREQRGADGLPEESPLATLDDEDLRAFQSWYARRAFHGGRPEDLTPEERAADESLTQRLRSGAARNKTVALAAVAGLVLVAGALGWRLARRRDSTASTL